MYICCMQQLSFPGTEKGQHFTFSFWSIFLDCSLFFAIFAFFIITSLTSFCLIFYFFLCINIPFWNIFSFLRSHYNLTFTVKVQYYENYNFFFLHIWVQHVITEMFFGCMQFEFSGLLHNFIHSELYSVCP